MLILQFLGLQLWERYITKQEQLPSYVAKLLLLKLLEDILWFWPLQEVNSHTPYQLYEVAVSVTFIFKVGCLFHSAI